MDYYSKYPWLTPIAETPRFRVMFTSRGNCEAGTSVYSDFNLCHYTGDDPAHVGRSRLMLADALGVKIDKIMVPRQVHSSNVGVIKVFPPDEDVLDSVDALVTAMHGLVIGVSTADCVPVVVVDEEAGVAGVAHAGWRGAVGGVVPEMLRTMLAEGASVGNMKAYFGPAICCDCFEVGEEVAAHFPEEYIVRKISWEKPHVNLPAYIAGQLGEFGLPSSAIEFFKDDFCTLCHPDRYFSARASGVMSGRNFTFVMLK